jgi:hypothetical protein
MKKLIRLLKTPPAEMTASELRQANILTSCICILMVAACVWAVFSLNPNL